MQEAWYDPVMTKATMAMKRKRRRIHASNQTWISCFFPLFIFRIFIYNPSTSDIPTFTILSHSTTISDSLVLAETALGIESPSDGLAGSHSLGYVYRRYVSESLGVVKSVASATTV